jgi:hypothetical protein
VDVAGPRAREESKQAEHTGCRRLEENIPMNTTTFARRIATTLSGPLVATGIILGSMVIGDDASANADPMSSGQSIGMTMTGSQDRAPGATEASIARSSVW